MDHSDSFQVPCEVLPSEKEGGMETSSLQLKNQRLLYKKIIVTLADPQL